MRVQWDVCIQHIYVLYECQLLLFFMVLFVGVVVSLSVFSHLPPSSRIEFPPVFCCNGFILLRKCLLCHLQGPWGRYTAAPGLPSWYSDTFPSNLLQWAVWVLLLSSVIHTRRLPLPSLSAHPGAWPRAGLATWSGILDADSVLCRPGRGWVLFWAQDGLRLS